MSQKGEDVLSQKGEDVMSQKGPAVVLGLRLLQVALTEALDGAEEGPPARPPVGGGQGRGLAAWKSGGGRGRRRRSL